MRSFVLHFRFLMNSSYPYPWNYACVVKEELPAMALREHWPGWPIS